MLCLARGAATIIVPETSIDNYDFANTPGNGGHYGDWAGSSGTMSV